LGSFVTAPSAQKATPHTTLASGIAQTVPLLPSQKPPHAPDPVQPGRPARGAPPTVVQIPRFPTWSHA
jgi:hypothetical protein